MKPPDLNRKAIEITVCKYYCTTGFLSTQCSPHDEPQDITSDLSKIGLQAYSGFGTTL
jgi:hypothetical protein